MKLSKLVTAVAALTLVFALVAAGCGGDDGGGDSPEDVTQSFYTALSDGDAAEICDLLSERAAQTAAEDEGADSCEDGVGKGIESGAAEAALGAADDVEIGEATIDGDSASVAVTSGEQEAEVPLVKEDGDWKIDIG